MGEIDLVMRDVECVVVVEVRFRSGRFVAPALTVDPRKQRKLVRTAALFLAGHPLLAALPVRFDVVAVLPENGADGRIQWIRDAFRP
jgi:putative endonuclease